MKSVQTALRRAVLPLAFAAMAAALVSIALCQSLMALALAALLASGERPRLPGVGLPLALFVLGTLAATALSADPAGGLPQVRKFFVFLMLPLVAGAFRETVWVRRLTAAWTGIAALSAGYALVQFGLKWREARALETPFYQHYVGERITGFMSHWMTFGGQMMIVLAMAGAVLLFDPPARKRLAWWLPAAALVAAAIALGFTRSVWLATASAGLYLLGARNRKLVLLVPVAVGLAAWLGPDALRTRIVSLVRPQGERDSNQHRIVTWRTGWRMIEAHPWFGAGPEQVGRRFEEFVPEDVKRPLPEGWYGHLHNIYLQYAAERGVPVLLALLWLLGKVLADCARALRNRAGPAERAALHGAVAVVIAVMVEGLFEHNLGDTEVLTMFLAVVGCAYVAAGRVGAAARA